MLKRGLALMLELVRETQDPPHSGGVSRRRVAGVASLRSWRRKAALWAPVPESPRSSDGGGEQEDLDDRHDLQSRKVGEDSLQCRNETQRGFVI